MQDKTKIFIITIAIIAVFGLLDAQQIIPWHQTQNWDMYNQFVIPAIVGMWVAALLGMAIVYYIVVKDKSEAIGIFIAGTIMLMGGLEDVSYFVLGGLKMCPQMCWFVGPQVIISQLFHETCVSPISLIFNTLMFFSFAFFVISIFFF